MPASIKVQLRERANRRHRGYIGRFGVPTAPGTKPRQYEPKGEAVFVPFTMPKPTAFDFGDFMRRINLRLLPPWLRHSKIDVSKDIKK